MKKVDWEKLAKQLQEALAKEMKEVERLENEIQKLNNELEVYADDGITLYVERKNKNAIICYLERRLFEEMKKNEQRNEEIPF
jgi:TRAP-type C4-dicarboxylate transport system substrate-binding protein